MPRPQSSATSEALAWLSLDPQRRVYDAAARFGVKPCTLYRALKRAGITQYSRKTNATS